MDVPAELKELSATLASIEAVVDVAALGREAADLEAAASIPNLWDDPENAQKVTSRLSFVQGEIRRVADLRRRVDDAQTLWDLAEELDDADSRVEAEGEPRRAPQGDRRARGAHPALRQSTTRARRW